VLAAGLVAVLAATAYAFINNVGKGDGVRGAGPPTGQNVLPTVPGDGPVVGTPGREVPVQGVAAPAVTVTVTVGGTQPVAQRGTSFTTKGGSVVAVCDAYGPRLLDIEAKPDYYPNQLSLVLAALVFFTRPADGTNPTVTYRLTITCASGGAEPKGTVTSYIGDQLVTPSLTPPATTASAPPSA